LLFFFFETLTSCGDRRTYLLSPLPGSRASVNENFSARGDRLIHFGDFPASAHCKCLPVESWQPVARTSAPHMPVVVPGSKAGHMSSSKPGFWRHNWRELEPCMTAYVYPTCSMWMCFSLHMKDEGALTAAVILKGY
jgi:hypothetical protein